MSPGLDKHLRHGAVGLAMGFALSCTGFSDYGEVHRMFVLADLRLLLSFALAVALSAAAFALFARDQLMKPRPLHRGILPGGALFGVGWAITGSCPSIALVQLGEGRLLAAFTCAGILAGAWLYPLVHGRYFRWDTGSCGGLEPRPGFVSRCSPWLTPSPASPPLASS